MQTKIEKRTSAYFWIQERIRKMKTAPEESIDKNRLERLITEAETLKRKGVKL